MLILAIVLIFIGGILIGHGIGNQRGFNKATENYNSLITKDSIFHAKKRIQAKTQKRDTRGRFR